MRRCSSLTEKMTLASVSQGYLAMALLLSVQFVLGMATNLFISIPNGHPGAHPSNYLAGSARSIGSESEPTAGSNAP